MDFENTIALNESADFNARHIKSLQDNRVKTVILAFNDGTGSSAMTDILISGGFSVKTISPDEIKGLSNDEIKGIIKKAETFRLKEESGVNVKKEN